MPEHIKTFGAIVTGDDIKIQHRNISGIKWKYKFFLWIVVIALISIVGYAIYFYSSFTAFAKFLKEGDHIFYWMLLAGFCAEIVAGSMGMGYGVICTTVLLVMNIPPPVISAGVHSAESFTCAAGSISHYKMGNVNKRLVRVLAVPAVLGAVAGAVLLTYVGKRYAEMTKPLIALYTMYLGIQILKNSFGKKKISSFKKKVNIPALGFVGGFIDSFGGGGWGPLVTGTFIKNGRTPRYVIGSSTVTKFILTLVSAITFIFIIGIHHWNIVVGLLMGGIVAAPFSAMLTTKLPVKKMFFLVGIVVILMSLVSIYKIVFA
ncbi:MAG: sulfite exporter TauE/SafE family protein [Bacteroidetes bacterium]|nr:sulfite exporter TauE/SafE family protein [Bacteroidota bacterium]MBS1931251.1 sulfite exporter TauE/SafE family protein [Bacteroidota bacterium]